MALLFTDLQYKMWIASLPPAYVVRQEGNSFTLFVSPHLRGGQIQLVGGGVSGPAGGGGGSGPAGGGSSPAGQEVGWVGQVQLTGGGQVQLTGGSGPADGGGQVQLMGGVQVQPSGGGSAKIGQQNEYSLLHGGRYASCVHAGGLSC